MEGHVTAARRLPRRGAPAAHELPLLQPAAADEEVRRLGEGVSRAADGFGLFSTSGAANYRHWASLPLPQPREHLVPDRRRSVLYHIDGPLHRASPASGCAATLRTAPCRSTSPSTKRSDTALSDFSAIRFLLALVAGGYSET